MLDRQFSHHQEGDGGFESFRQHNDRAACLFRAIAYDPKRRLERGLCLF
jgi:hypothetical protein